MPSPLTRFERITKRVLLTLIALFSAPFLLIFFLQIIGYHVTEPGWRVGEIAAAKGDVSICSNVLVMPWKIFSPPGPIQRMDCIDRYASITLDPTACELLLPNEYVLHCLGAVRSELSKGFGCGSNSRTITCEGGITSDKLGLENCSIYQESVLIDWCHTERTATLENIDECDLVSAEPVGLREECQMRYAFKEKDPALCDSIQHAQRRELCEIEINVWNEYADEWELL